MTGEQTINFIKTHKRFPRKSTDYFDYWLLIIPLSSIVAGCVRIFQDNQLGHIEKLFPGIAFLLIGILLFRFFRQRLKENLLFTSQTTNCQKAENISIACDILKTDLVAEPEILDENLGIVVGRTKISAFSWGETITVLCEDGRVWVNSNPNQPITIKKDKTNVTKILDRYKIMKKCPAANTK